MISDGWSFAFEELGREVMADMRGNASKDSQAAALLRQQFVPPRYANAKAAETCEQPTLVRPLRAVGYARRSTDEQYETSIERQEEVCREYARGRDIQLERVFIDRGKSGAFTKNRSALKKMLASAGRREFDILIVESVCRLSRSQSDTYKIFKDFNRLGIEVHTRTGKVDNDQLCADAFKAQQEREGAVELLELGRIQMAEEGRVANPCPYGFIWARGEAGRLAIDPDEREKIHGQFELAAEGWTPAEIAEKFKVQAPPSHLPSTVLLRRLRNALYAGIVSYRKQAPIFDESAEIVVGRQLRPSSEWTAVHDSQLEIVDIGLFRRVQEKLASRSRAQVQRTDRRRSVLVGKAWCGVCGRRYQGDYGFADSGKYFVCKTTEQCRQSQPRIAPVERAVAKAIRDIVQHSSQSVTESEALVGARLRAKLIELEGALDRDVQNVLFEGAEPVYDAGEHEELELQTSAIEQALRNVQDGLCAFSADELLDWTLVALDGAEDEPLPNVEHRLFSAIRKILERVTLFPMEAATRIELILNFAAIASEFGDTDIVRMVETSAPDQHQNIELREQRIRQKTRAGLISVVEDSKLELSSQQRDQIDATVPGIRSLLAPLGWSLSQVVCATGLKKRKRFNLADMPDIFGRPATFLEAQTIVQQSGHRGEIACVLKVLVPHLYGACDALFSKGSGWFHMHPTVEQAMARKNVGVIKVAAKNGSVQFRGQMKLTCEWLKESNKWGRAAAFQNHDPTLTARLALLRMSGVEELCDVENVDSGAFISELKDACEEQDPKSQSALNALCDHLRGYSIGEIAARNEITAGRTHHQILQYRASGLDGIVGRERAFGRLAAAELEELVVIAKRGVDPARPSEPIDCVILARICSSRFERFYTPAHLQRMMTNAGVSVWLRAGCMALSRPQQVAHELGWMDFEALQPE